MSGTHSQPSVRARRERRAAATATTTADAPRPIAGEGAHGRCSLTLSIDGTKYKVRPIEPGFAGHRAYRLTKADGTAYVVTQLLEGTACDCPDGTRRECKHVRSAKAVGLIG